MAKEGAGEVCEEKQWTTFQNGYPEAQESEPFQESAQPRGKSPRM